MSQIKTITTSTGQNKLSFDAFYAYVWLKNLGSADVYVADYAGASSGDVDTAILPAGEAIRIVTKTKDVYIYGATTIEAHAQNFADEPFGWGSSGGGDTPVVVSPLTVTENGTYTVPTGVDGYSPVTVAVPTGAEIITRADWNALTTAQKQSKSFVAIQDSVSGYNRGVLVNGADYVPINNLLPYSTEQSVLCSANAADYISGALTWGIGDEPVLMSKTGASVSDGAVLIPASTADTYAYLHQPDTEFTVYMVLKAVGSISGARLCVTGGHSSNRDLILIRNANGHVYFGSWDTDTDTGVLADSFFVCAIRWDSTLSEGTCIIYDATTDTMVTKTVTPSQLTSNLITFGRNLGNYPVNSDVSAKFIGLVDVAETNTVMENNVRSLYQTFVSQE